jgi:hypothetical protein
MSKATRGVGLVPVEFFMFRKDALPFLVQTVLWKASEAV